MSAPAPHSGFASDNTAGVHPEVFDALQAADHGAVPSYGRDPYTARLAESVRRHFGPAAQVFPVFGGTGANIVGLHAMSDPWSSVFCAASSHLHVDECGAAEKVAGLKVIALPVPDGKLTPEVLRPHLTGFGDQHHAQPKIISIAQCTETGTVYTPAETAALASLAHANGMLLHLDGARLGNAAAYLDLPLRALTTDVGVDVLSFGATKNGAMFGEAVVVLEPSAVRGVEYIRKMDLQTPSKARYISAQLSALLDGDLWLRNARHANAMARRLADAVRAAPGARITQPVQSNAVFAIVPAPLLSRLREHYTFFTWAPETNEIRLMCSFRTTHEDIETFARHLIP